MDYPHIYTADAKELVVSACQAALEQPCTGDPSAFLKSVQTRLGALAEDVTMAVEPRHWVIGARMADEVVYAVIVLEAPPTGYRKEHL